MDNKKVRIITRAERMSPCSLYLKQARFVLLLLLKFKARRLPISLIAILLLPSNYWLFESLYQTDSSRVTQRMDSSLISSPGFTTAWQVLIDHSNNTSARQELLEIMAGRGAARTSWLKSCNGMDNCRREFYGNLRTARLNNMIAWLVYNSTRFQLECLQVTNSDVICPFIYQLMVQSISKGASDDSVFKEVHFFKYIDRKGNIEDLQYPQKKKLNVSFSDTVCGRAEMSGTFIFALWYTVVYHVLLATTGCTMHFAATTVAFIASLKENGFLQLMFNNGLSVGAYWTVILCISVLESAIFASILSLCYSSQCPDVYPTGIQVKVFLIFMFYCLSLVAVGLLATVVLPSYFLILMTNVAGTLIIMAIAVISIFRIAKQDGIDDLLFALLLYPPGHLATYLVIILQPPKYATYWSGADESYCRSIRIGMISFPIVLTVATVYLDFLLASGNGLRLPPSFLFCRDFWQPGATKLTLTIEAKQVKRANIEPNSGIPTIQIRGISMIYGSGSLFSSCRRRGSQVKAALNDVTYTVFRDQITGLIGHNGAGKTSLIRVITGEESPTSGTVIIDGRMPSDPYQRLAMRGRVSVCKQVDVLSRQLTVMDSIRMALLSKGFRPSSHRDQISSMMALLGLSGKENVNAWNLSGGQLRKVCCIIALLGDPKVVLLDEPTSGLDPVSRRSLWQILQDYKAGRCIILCTQFMDEADILADRKLFLSSGRLICAGSSIFLKHMFGCTANIGVSLNAGSHVAQLRGLMRWVRVVRQFKTELHLQLKSADPMALISAVKILEDLKKKHIVIAFGVSPATLDEIFMRLKDVKVETIQALLRTGHPLLQNVVVTDTPVLPPLVENLPNSPSVRRKFVALMSMNFRRQFRSRIHLGCRFVLPIILIIVIAVIVHLEKGRYNSQRELVQKLEANVSAVDSKKLEEMTLAMQLYETVRFPIFPFQIPYTVCISDESDTSSVSKDQCVLATNSWQPAVTLVKAPKVSLISFLSTNESVKSHLRRFCSTFCPIVYSTSWNTSESNRYRSLSIGLYEKHDIVFTKEMHCLDLFNSVAQYFDAAQYFKQIRLTVIERFQNFYCFHNELYIFMLLFSILPATFMMDPVEDRTTRVRQQMRVMGLSSRAYWTNTFVIHWTQYAVYLLISMLMCLQWERYRSTYVLCWIGLPLLCMGTVSNLLTVYCIGTLQENLNHTVTAGYFFFMIFLCSMTTFVMKNSIASVVCTWLMPPLAPLMLAVAVVKDISYGLLYYDMTRVSDLPDIWSAHLSRPDTKSALAAMGCHIFLLAAFLMATENWSTLSSKLQQLRYMCTSGGRAKGQNTAAATKAKLEDGVRLEIDRLRLGVRSKTNLLEVRDLRKTYPNGVAAVRGVTFGAISGEILGLLGPNGAGKTSVMSVLVGEAADSGGTTEVRFLDTWMPCNRGARQGAIGYCPQHNPLFDRVTVDEHLHFYAVIRGLPQDQTASQVSALIANLGLEPHKDKWSMNLSGGNKRRLCLAIALLGCPSVVVVDEASTGVDPENKRAIWSSIRGMTSKGKRSVLITTHSMEEVEALCSRVCIMNRGVMIGFGTVQQLRSRYGDAYTLDVLLEKKSKDSKELKYRKAVLEGTLCYKFPGSTVLDNLCASMQFYMPAGSLGILSDSLQWLVDQQAKLGLRCFSLYQISLDQVYIKMMTQHANEKETPLN